MEKKTQNDWNDACKAMKQPTQIEQVPISTFFLFSLLFSANYFAKQMIRAKR